MLSTKEKQLIKIIRYSPIILVAVICFLLTYFLLSQNSVKYEKESEEIKSKYINSHRLRVKDEVQRVINYINYETSNSEDDLRKFIKSKVYEAHSIATSIYEKYKTTKSKKEILELISTAIRPLRFNNGRGYFYVNSMQGLSVMHPIQPEFEGQNNINIKDSRGNYILRRIIEGLKKNNDFYAEIYWNQPSDLAREYKKITFNKLFEPYDLIIGTGEYLDDFQGILKKRILNYISKIRYDENGYIFVFNYDGYQLSHIKDSYIGLNRLNTQDKNGTFLVKQIIETAKDGEGYVNYFGTIKPNTGKAAQKTSFIKGYDDFGWAIGSGFYVEELNREVLEKEAELTQANKQYIYKLLLTSLILSSIFLVISIYFSKELERRFLSYRKRVLEEITSNREKDNMLAQQSKMAAMGEMLANIAHQWRQPLSTISTAASGIKIKKQMDMLDDNEFFDSMDMINDSVQHLSQTIDDFSDYFNPHKKKQKFYLKDTVEKAFKLLSKQLSDVNVETLYDINDIEINSYENEFLQVLINIFNNAKDELKKTQKRRLIYVSAFKEEDYVVVSIKDSALGIPQKIQERIFEPYFTTKHKGRGTGIGLYMCQEIVVKHMGGTISAKNSAFEFASETYYGAEFIIRLPISMPDSLEEFVHDQMPVD